MAGLVTKQQLQNILAAWDVAPPREVPKKGSKMVICWPKGTVPEAATVEWTNLKSEYGERLYRIEMGSVEEVFAGTAQTPKGGDTQVDRDVGRERWAGIAQPATPESRPRA